MNNRNKVVLKFGGSVLYSKRDFERISHEIQRYVSNNYQVVAVVSAYFGVTEKLLSMAAEKQVAPGSAEFAEIVASGEIESASQLTSYLINHGFKVSLRMPSEFNFLAGGNRESASPISINANQIKSALKQTPVIIMPGFSAIDKWGDCILLGRGGSDISALCVSEALGLDSVRLLKDVDGFYSSDPNKFSNAKRYTYVNYKTACRIGGELIQPQAIDFAASRRICIDVAAIGRSYASRIGPDTNDISYGATCGGGRKNTLGKNLRQRHLTSDG